ncbi:MAG: glycoside hydrolase family 28 protein [Cyclobacteriaceae bacterium]
MRIIYLLPVMTMLFACASEEPVKSLKEEVEVPFAFGVFDEPTFGNYEVLISEFGAKTGGQFNNASAIARAIADVAAKPKGGKVIIPAGIWLSGPIELKNNINLHLQEGALLVFSRNQMEYPLVETSFEGLNTVRCQSPIYAKNLENIAITGKGIIDGSGDAWRMVKRSKMTDGQWNRLIKSGGVLSDSEDVWYPSQSFKEGAKLVNNFNVPRNMKTMEEFETIHDFLRPVMISIVGCKGVLLDGPTFQNSPAWNIHPLMSENIIIRNIDVRNPWYSQNGDGLDIESCKNVIVENATFDVGDDAICIKSGKNEDGRERGIPTENLIVRNCVVYHGHGGFVVGSEMSGGVKNVLVSDMTFIGTDIGLRFKSTRGRGGVVENIHIRNVNMTNIATDAIRFNLFYTGNSPVIEPEQKQVNVDSLMALIPEVSEETPSFKSIFMDNIVSIGAQRSIYLQGLPEMNIKDISISNSTFVGKRGMECFDGSNITLDNVIIGSDVQPAIRMVNAKEVQFDGLSLQGDSKGIEIFGPFGGIVSFTETNVSDESIVVGPNVDKALIQIN